MDNKQQYPGGPDPFCMGYQGPSQPGYPQGAAGYPQGAAGYPQGPGGYPQGTPGYPLMTGAGGYPPQGGFPQTGFAGPGFGAGAPPPMGFHMPMPEQPKPYSDGRDFGEYGGHGEGMDFSEKTIRMAFIRFAFIL